MSAEKWESILTWPALWMALKNGAIITLHCGMRKICLEKGNFKLPIQKPCGERWIMDNLCNDKRDRLENVYNGLATERRDMTSVGHKREEKRNAD